MERVSKLFITILVISLSLTSCKVDDQDGDVKMIKEKISKFAKTEIRYDKNLLDERQKIVIKKLFEAAKIIDELFLEQVYAGNTEIKNELSKSDKEYDKLTLDYFNLMFGPFDRLNHDYPFIGKKKKPLGANFYPEDLTKEEFEKWIEENPDDQESFTSEFTIIRRSDEGLQAIPYSEYYKDKLSRVANLLREASEFADNTSLKKVHQLFLRLRIVF
jgi:hypothetical protein